MRIASLIGTPMLKCLVIVGTLVMTLTTPLHVVAATPDMAPAVLTQHNMSLVLANGLATGALEACKAIGKTVVVAVVDRGGNLVALQRGDDVGPHNTLAAQRKAFTALSTKTRTGLLAERARADDASQNLNTVAELLLLGGGVPVAVNGQVIGAVGVAGAGGSANDEGCAIKAIQTNLGDNTAK